MMLKTHTDSSLSSVQAAEALARVKQAKRRRLLGHTLGMTAVAAVGAQGLVACTAETEDTASSAEQADTDWTVNEGERNTDMVQYRGDNWTEFSECNTRGGCMVMDVIVKIFVKPVPGANLDAKRVGAVFRMPYWQQDEFATAMGSYFSTGADGWEEWQVRIRLRAYEYPRVPIFTAFYQDGLGTTYKDDNAGEHHVAGDLQNTLSQAWCCVDGANDVAVTDQGVEGGIGLRVLDIDWDKDIELVWTTDHWQHANVYGFGDGANGWHWMQDLYSGFDLFRIDLDIPGDFDQLEYAVHYRHGVVDGAKSYDFWDNNGGYNYVVTRGGPPQ